MVVVYLKNGEKAPMPDANYVKLEVSGDTPASRVLRCFYGNTEVGFFRWEEVAGYTVSTMPAPNVGYPDAWTARMEAQV